ncbi:hypothetical protein DH2020_016851 [Rehmannia glutinosa]|uniref:Reverse transcriptase domain-containing protein n=1 Tax=Rehmannia glutinosa TaxID=99300 RepID=A0ABR0WRU1_REHGL
MDFSLVDQVITPRVGAQANATLTAIPSDLEVKEAVFDMDSDSSPGPDGFNGIFYRHFWDVISAEVTADVRFFFSNSSLPLGLNASFMELIPKTKDANVIENFRPIVMSNFIFKIITKILATRLGLIVSDYLSPMQFGFIPGRQIHDCIAMVSEGFNVLQGRTDANMIVKTDIRKAFDTLSWDFLLYVLCHFGFSETFVRWVEVVLRSSRIYVLLNGTPVGYFPCFKGVRQGDPLSPLLFCIAEEVLGRLIEVAMDRAEEVLGRPRGIVFPSSILYADDIVIMSGASSANARILLQILTLYADISGQAFNPRKSKVYFGSRVSNHVRGRVQSIMGIHLGAFPMTYLGAPIFKGVPKAAVLQPVFDKVILKFRIWKGTSLSLARRVCLVNSVITSSLVHTMMVYKWPRSLLSKW